MCKLYFPNLYCTLVGYKNHIQASKLLLKKNYGLNVTCMQSHIYPYHVITIWRCFKWWTNRKSTLTRLLMYWCTHHLQIPPTLYIGTILLQKKLFWLCTVFMQFGNKCEQWVSRTIGKGSCHAKTYLWLAIYKKKLVSIFFNANVLNALRLVIT